jgi:hypothetical protein
MFLEKGIENRVKEIITERMQENFLKVKEIKIEMKEPFKFIAAQ